MERRTYPHVFDANAALQGIEPFVSLKSAAELTRLVYPMIGLDSAARAMVPKDAFAAPFVKRRG